jgi:ribosomal protein S7
MEARLLFVQAFNNLRVPFTFTRVVRGSTVLRKAIFLPQEKQVNKGLHLLKREVFPGTHKGTPTYQVLAGELFAAWHRQGNARRKRTEILKMANAENTD